MKSLDVSETGKERMTIMHILKEEKKGEGGGRVLVLPISLEILGS